MAEWSKAVVFYSECVGANHTTPMFLELFLFGCVPFFKQLINLNTQSIFTVTRSRSVVFQGVRIVRIWWTRLKVFSTYLD